MKKILSIGLLSLLLLLHPNNSTAQVGAAVNGGIVVQARPFSLGANTFTAAQTITINALGTTSTDGLVIQNTTASTVGTTVQISPRAKFCGTAWASGLVASQTDCFIIEVRPELQVNPTRSAMYISSSIAGGAFGDTVKVYDRGAGVQGNYFEVSGAVHVGRSSDLQWIDMDGTARSLIRSPSDGLVSFGMAAGTGAGIDVTTASILAVRTFVQSGDGAVRASFYNSSTISTLTFSTNTIAPTSAIHHLGAGLIKTITVPVTCTPTCVISIIPDAAYTYDNTGNVTVPVGAGLALISKVMTFTWDGTKWNPSY